MNRIVPAKFGVLLGSCIAIFLTSCTGGISSGSGSGNSAINMAGTWKITTVSTSGNAPNDGFSGFSGATMPLSQSGVGLGVNGETTLSATIGTITLTQSGAVLIGTITYSIPVMGGPKVSYNFAGTLSGGSFTITGSVSCGGNSTQSTTLVGTVTSNSASGTYTVNRGSGCYYTSTAGSFVATKQ